MKKAYFFSEIFIFSLAAFVLWVLPASSGCPVYAAPVENFLQEQQDSYVSQLEEVEFFLSQSTEEIQHTVAQTPQSLPVGNFLLENAYPVHFFEHPDFVSYYREHGLIDTNIQPDYRWNIPTSTGYLITVSQDSSGAWNKLSGIGTDFRPIEGSADISGVFDRQKLLETVKQNPAIKNISELSYISSPMYTSTTFIYILSDGQEFLIPYGLRPDLTGLENGTLYSVQEAADILEVTSPQQVYGADSEAPYGGAGASTENPVSAGNNAFLVGGGIALAALIVVILFLLYRRKRISQ